MPRFALRIEYDGRPFAGWQWQAAHPSVQAALEAAVARLETALPARVVGAGRTDAGVHATGQVAHVDLGRDWEPFRLMQALNAHLRPDPIAVVAAARVPDHFHARFGAVEREYRFRLVARRSPLVHDRGLAWRVGHRLDLEAMRAGAAASGRAARLHHLPLLDLPGEVAAPHARCARRSRSSHIPAGVEYRFRVRARSFLHNQVRGIVGTLERVGAGAWPPERVAVALAARDRAACGPVCPPDGLYLAAVRYAEDPFAEP